MKVNVLFKDMSKITIENIFAVSNTSTKFENDTILIKVRNCGNEWQATKIKCKDILCIEVIE